MDENNQIQFTNLTLDSAFQKFYTVPDYQREYVWKEEQVEQLLADITEAFRANRSKDYFVGSVVVYPNGKAFELVDGQQRMTTFFILLCVLKSFYQINGVDTGIFEQCIHGTTVDDSGHPVSLYRNQWDKATEKRNRYQKVIICTSEPRRLIFDYCGAISALPEAFFFGYSGAIFERSRSPLH